MAEWQLKATAMVSLINRLRRRLPARELDRMVQGLPPPARALFERRLLPVEWIDMEAAHQLNLAVLQTVCGGDEARFLAFVKENARENFNLVYRVFIRALPAMAVLERGMRVLRTFCSRGELVVGDRRTLDDRVRVEVHVTGYHPQALHAVVVQAYLEALLELNGTRDLDVTRGKPDLRPEGLAVDYLVAFRA
jgi:hypothetical protein